MAIVLGLDAKLLRGDVGATGATEVKNVKDLTLNLESGDADVTTRATGGWRASAATIALFVTDGNGGGLDADWSITAFTVEQPLEEAVSVSITAKPTASTRAPTWKNAGA